MNRLIWLVILPLFLVGCTISFSNIATHGTATDLVDEEQGVSPTISPTINVPLTPKI